MTTTTGRRLSAYSRQVTALVHEARDVASVPVDERDTDTYRGRLTAFHIRKAKLLAGRSDPDRDR